MKHTPSLPSLLTDRFSYKLLSCIGLVAMADYFFFGKGPRHFGCTLGLWIAALLLVIGLHRRWQKATRPAAWLIGGATFGLALALIENPNLLGFFLIVLGLISLAALHNATWFGDTLRWLQHLIVYSVMHWGRLFVDVFRWLRAGRRSKSLSLRWLGYWLVPALLSILFLVLFYIANPVIHQWLNALNIQVLIDLLSPRRWLYWFAIAWISWGLIRPKMYRLTYSNPHEAVDAPPKLSRPVYDFFFNTTSITSGLVVFNLIFFLQTILDVIYLWSSRALPEGLTHAEYAHRGTYPLIFAALLAAGFVLVALHPNSSSERNPTVRTLVFFWILQTVFLVTSSVWRTWLYIEEYSLTYLRISALIWMGLVTAGLLYIIVRILLGKTNRWLVNINCATLLCVLYLCSWLDFSSMIAWYNVRHCQEITNHSQALDLDYMEKLGPPALPALRWYIDKLGGSDAAETRGVKAHSRETEDGVTVEVEVTTFPNGRSIDDARVYAMEIESELYEDLIESLATWRSWTWRKQRILDELQACSAYRDDAL